MYSLIKKALQPYSIGNESLTLEKTLHTDSWNGDLHFKILADDKAFSARFIKHNRSPNPVFGEISNDCLLEQIKFCRFLSENQIPFMRIFPVSENKPFTIIEWDNVMYRFVLFEWIEGQHITNCTTDIAAKFGKIAREMHDISSLYTSTVFTKKSHLEGYSKFINMI